MCVIDLDFEAKFRKAVQDIGSYGEQYAEAKAQSWQAQELKHSLIASIIASMGDVPLSRAELQAKNSDDFRKYVAETSLAIKKELTLKAKYEKARATFEALRSLSSLEKSTRTADRED